MDVDELNYSFSKKGKNFWGRILWGVIHILSYTLRQGKEEFFKEYLFLLTKILPCNECKKNLEYKLMHHPPDMYMNSSDIPKSSFYYSYILHDLANQDITQKNPSLPPKISPPYETAIQKYKIITSSSMMYKYVWASIHVLTVTLHFENIRYYKRMLEVLSELLPERDGEYIKYFLQKYPIDPYLRNNQDAFFYSYMMHDVMNKKLGKKSPPYIDVKIHYFSALKQECIECGV